MKAKARDLVWQERCCLDTTTPIRRPRGIASNRKNWCTLAKWELGFRCACLKRYRQACGSWRSIRRANGRFISCGRNWWRRFASGPGPAHTCFGILRLRAFATISLRAKSYGKMMSERSSNMARAMWSGSISFGLVNVPVKMVTAVLPNDVHFHQLRASDGARIQYKKVSVTDQEEVEYKDIVKGYEVAPNQYVKIKPEELNALDPEARRTIDIDKFVDLKEIDPIYFEHSYYLEPDKNAGKAYALLQQAMHGSGKVGIAKMVMHNREHIVALRGTGQAIAMSTMYFKDEVVSEKELALPAEADKPQKKELAIALQLVESISGEFDPEKYHDEYRERVLNLIKQKAEGKEVVTQKMPKTTAPNVVNLMDALKASLAESAKKRKAGQSIGAHTAKPKARKSA